MAPPTTIARIQSRLLGLAVAFGAASALSGCPGTLDESLLNVASGSGGNNGGGTGGTGGNGSGGSNNSDGSTGSGGSNNSGGSTGSGGSTVNCTGGNDGATLIAKNCAVLGCHIPGTASDGVSGGLDLTIDSGIRGRLVDVFSGGTAANMSQCMGNSEPYLKGGSSPASGLLLDKMKTTHPCGSQMPIGLPLSSTQQTCIQQWATTLTSP